MEPQRIDNALRMVTLGFEFHTGKTNAESCEACMDLFHNMGEEEFVNMFDVTESFMHRDSFHSRLIEIQHRYIIIEPCPLVKNKSFFTKIWEWLKNATTS